MDMIILVICCILSRVDLGIPVFHDDQHGTAIVVLAGLINACKVIGKNLEDFDVKGFFSLFHLVDCLTNLTKIYLIRIIHVRISF